MSLINYKVVINYDFKTTVPQCIEVFMNVHVYEVMVRTIATCLQRINPQTFVCVCVTQYSPAVTSFMLHSTISIGLVVQ